MNEGRTVFAQLLDFLPKYEFDKCVARFLEALAEEAGLAYDPFDLVCHVAYDQPPLTRKERAANVRKRNYFTKYGEQAAPF